MRTQAKGSDPFSPGNLPVFEYGERTERLWC